jgi:hypothetical protein
MGVDRTGTRNLEEELVAALGGDVHGLDANGLDAMIPGRTVFPYIYTSCCGQDLKDGGGCTSAVYMVCVDCAEKSPLCELSPEELAQIVTEAERERQQAEAVGKSMPEADIAGAYRGMLGGW